MRTVLPLLVLLAASPALAAEPAAPKPPPYVDLYPFAAPIVQDGRLVNYVFVTIRLHGKAGADPSVLKRLEPKLRDAMVRAAHRRSFAAVGDPTSVDTARVAAAALAEGRRIGDVFASAEVRKQTPQHRRVAPSKPAA